MLRAAQRAERALRAARWLCSSSKTGGRFPPEITINSTIAVKTKRSS